jgi:hypothetical protein
MNASPESRRDNDGRQVGKVLPFRPLSFLSKGAVLSSKYVNSKLKRGLICIVLGTERARGSHRMVHLVFEDGAFLCHTESDIRSEFNLLTGVRADLAGYHFESPLRVIQHFNLGRFRGAFQKILEYVESTCQTF